MALTTDYKIAIVNGGNTTVDFSGNDHTVSTLLFCGGAAPTGILFPSNWNSGAISFLASKTNSIGNSYILSSLEGAAFGFAINVSGGKLWLPLNPAIFNSIPYIAVVSTVVQPSTLALDFMLAPIYQAK